MTELKPYPEYKDSGIEWIGEIPVNWNINKIRNVSRTRMKNIPVKTIKKSKWYYYDIPTIQQNNSGKIEDGKNIASNKFELLGDEILVSKLNPRKGTVILVAENKTEPMICSTELIPIVAENINKKFLYYWLVSSVTADVFNSMVTSVTYSHERISGSDIENYYISTPALEIQNKIVEYLENRISNIEKLIKAKKHLIKLLEEKRQAIITETVTKGLDPNVKMKDSGIEWIGEIPEHWQLSRIKYNSNINKRTLSEKTAPDKIITYIDIGNVDSSGNIIGKEKYKFKDAPSRARRVVKKGDTIVSTVRTYLQAITMINETSDENIVSTGFAVFTPKSNVVAEYLGLYFRSTSVIDRIVSLSKGVNYPAINTMDLSQIEIGLPPYEEQKEIVSYIYDKFNLIEETIRKIKSQIIKLEEFRESLIFEAVTGKLDLRNFKGGEI